jgi:hypothetical protein
MSERRAYVSPKEFIESIHPATVAGMCAVEHEVSAEHRQMDEAIGWLLDNHGNPLADPNHRLGYEHRVERVIQKLEKPYGQA